VCTCRNGTSGTFTQKTLLSSHGKDHTHVASSVRCSAIQNTPTHPFTGVPDGGRAENTEGLGHHIVQQRASIGESRVVFATSDEFSPKMTKISGQCVTRSRRLGGYGLEWGKSYRWTTLCQRSAPSSTRWLCSWSSYMAAKHGAAGGVPHPSCLPHG